MKSFEIGPGLTCDLNQLVDTRLLVQANSGGGKSWALRRLLEQTHGQLQHLVIDPEGEFASLREKFDYVLAAPSGGDTAAHPKTAQLLAERLLELKVSAILDIYELKPHERIRFVRLFLEALVNAPKGLWHPALIVLDEAHVYAPQVGEAESAGAVRDLATRGRKRGFCLIPATQRLSKLHKDVAAECNNKLIGRTSLDVDMKRAADELGLTGKDPMSLRQLTAGSFFAYGPAFGGTEGVTTVRVGDVKTTHPKAGGRIAFTAPPPTSKVRALLPQLADLPQEAAEREKSIDDLKRELANTKRELTLARKEHPAPAPEVKIVEKPVLKDGQLARAEAIVSHLEQLAGKCSGYEEDLRVTAKEIRDAIASTRAPQPVAAPRALPPNIERVAPRTAATPRVAAERNGDLTGPEQRILDALAWMESIGVMEPEQTAVAFLANYTYGAGSFNNPRGSLRQRGYVEYLPSNRIRLTDAGRRLANAPDAPLDVAELHRRVLDRLPGPEQRLLRPLLDSYPKPMSNADLAAAANYQDGAGSFNSPKGRLRSLGLIDYPQKGFAVAKPLLFLEER